MEKISAKVITKKCKIAPANETVVIDAIPLADLRFLTYSISYENSDKTKARGLKVDLFKDDNSFARQVYGMGGDCFDVVLDAAENNGIVELTLTNNEPQDITICFAKLKL